jgi:hypothetical protein
MHTYIARRHEPSQQTAYWHIGCVCVCVLHVYLLVFECVCVSRGTL